MHSDFPMTRAFLLALPLLLAGCGAETSQSAEPATVHGAVATAIRTTAQDSALASGTVEADERAQLVAQTMGTIRTTELYDGEQVRRGQVLATIDPRQADAAAGRARAALDAARAEQHDAQRDVTRDAPLTQSGALSGDAYRKEQLRSTVAAAGVTQAQAAFGAAAAVRSNTSIVSPFDGVVVDRHVRDGDIVMPGTPLVTVENRGWLVFRFAAPQTALKAFAPGRSVPVLLDGREDRPAVSRVRGVVPSADPATRRYTVELVLPRDSEILPGMFGRVRLPSSPGHGDSTSAVSVPAASVADRGGLTGVFVVGGDRRLTFRWLRLGERTADRIVVTSGLSAGERVLAQVDPSVRDGARLAGGAAQ